MSTHKFETQVKLLCYYLIMYFSIPTLDIDYNFLIHLDHTVISVGIKKSAVEYDEDT